MSDGITRRQFHESEGVEDWRVLSEGACVFFRTGSFAEGAMLVAAIGARAGLAELHSYVDLRHVRTVGPGLRQGIIRMA